MLSLYQKRSSVEFRPGLELEMCQCGRGSSYPYDWRHIYECHKAITIREYGFLELCFLYDEWLYGHDAWEGHCQYHLDHPDCLPIWYDPLIYGGVLARARYCPFCIEDKRLSASVCMHQFKIRWTWLGHIQTHVRLLQERSTALQCPHAHSHYPGKFDSILELQFYLQDAFGVERISTVLKTKRPKCKYDDIEPTKRQMIRRCRNNLKADDIMAFSLSRRSSSNYDIDNLRTKGILSPTLIDDSLESTPFYSLSGMTFDTAALGSSTLLSSISSKEMLDPAIFTPETKIDEKLMDLNNTS